MKELTKAYLKKTQETYEQNAIRAWEMLDNIDNEPFASTELNEAVKRGLKYQAHKTHGMAVAVAKVSEADSITLELLYEVKEAYRATENKLEVEGKEDDAAKARGSKEVIEELIFVMTGSFPEMK